MSESKTTLEQLYKVDRQSPFWIWLGKGRYEGWRMAWIEESKSYNDKNIRTKGGLMSFNAFKDRPCVPVSSPASLKEKYVSTCSGGMPDEM